MSLNLLLWIVSAIGEAVVIGLLAYRKTWKTLPWFFLFCVWALTSDIAEYVVSTHFRSAYLNTYFIARIIESVLEFGVLVELAWSVFRPYQKSLPRATVWVLGIVLGATGAAIWPFVRVAGLAHERAQWQYLGRVEQTDSILKVLLFLILAGCSQLLSIGWRDRELQVATGFGFYSLAALAVSMVHTHQTAGAQYLRLDQILVGCYVCSLAYWVFSFAQKEVERREFSPQMQGLLLAVAGAARSTRISMTEGTGKPANGGHR